MENWCNMFLHYNGHFDHSWHYIGGQERLIYLSSANISIAALRSTIQTILDAEGVGGEYNMYYTFQTQSGRNGASLLTENAELQRLLNFYSEPDIYIIMNPTINTGAGTSRREPSPYIPFISSVSPQPYARYSPTESELQRFTSSMHFDISSEGGSRGSHIPDLNDELAEDHNYDEEDEEADFIPEYHTGTDGGVVEEEADEEADLDSSGSESDTEGENFLMDCTVAEFSAWIRSAGGMSAFISNLMPTNPLLEGCPVQGDMNNWLVPIMPVDTTEAPVVRDVASILDQELSLGAMFWKKDDLLIAVGLWHMENRHEFKVKKSDSIRVDYICKRSENCSFQLRARCRNGCWIIRHFQPNHNCMLNLAGIGSRNIRSKVVAAYFARRMRRQGQIIKPRAIMAELQRTFGIRASYVVALRSRNAAISLMYGSITDSYKLLPRYLEVLRQYNPGTITDLDIEQDGTFRHCFVALGVSRLAFNNNLLRQVIVIDATHLKGRSKGILLVAVTKDGNENVFPLALGVGPIENDETWTWFLSRLRMCFAVSEQLLIVSDQHVSIGNAVNAIYPGTAHGICFYHLQNKLTTHGPTIVKLYHRAAYAYRLSSYRQAMDQIRSSKPVAYDKLISVGPERWCRSKCPVRRYSFLTSNAAEVFNARLLEARRLPICSIIDTYRGILEQWFDQRRAKANARVDELTEEAVQKASPLSELAHTHQVVPISDNEFKVTDRERTWKVDLTACTCECREFQLDLMPCSHAIAAIRYNGVNYYDYVHSYYKTSNWREIYGGTVNSLPPEDEWYVSDEAASLLVKPPNITRQAGRPRNSRRPSGAETSSSRQRAHKKCSICKSESHTKRSCPDRVANT